MYCLNNTVKAHSRWLPDVAALLFDRPSPLPIPASQAGSADVEEDSRSEEIKSELISDLPRVVISNHLDLLPSILSIGSTALYFQFSLNTDRTPLIKCIYWLMCLENKLPTH